MVATGLLLAVALQAGALEPIQTVEIGKNRELRVNGKPFFPILSWLQRPSRFPRLAELGFNTFCGGKASDLAEPAGKAGGYAMAAYDEALKGHARILAYTHGDEPDLGIEKGKPRRPAEEIVALYKRLRASDSSRPVFLNLTGAFMEDGPGVSRETLADRTAYYRTVAGGADILCFDVYPIYGWNRPDKLVWVADGVRELRGYAGAKPVFAWIETSKGSRWIDYDRQKDVTPAHTRAEVWMAIIRGATGIGYFTHAWRPSFAEFNPTGEMQAELKRLNAQIARLAPALLADPAPGKVAIKIAGGLAGDILAKEHEGRTYLFAINLDMQGKGGRATIEVAGLKRGTAIEVVDEARTLTADEGWFADGFSSLAVHVYRFRP